MNRLILLLVLLSSLSACVNKHANADTDRINNRYFYEYTLIYKDYGKVPLDTTLDHLEMYLKEFPKSYEGWAFMGRIHTDRHEYDKSEMAYRTALTCNPKFSPAMSGLGVIYSWTGRYDSALIYIDKAIAAGDTSAGSYLRLAIIDIERGDTSAARIIDRHFHQMDTLDEPTLAFLAGVNKELRREQNLKAILAILEKKNVQDSLLDLYLDGKINGTAFFNQRGQYHSNDK